MQNNVPADFIHILKRIMRTSFLVLALFWNTVASLNATVANGQNALDRKISIDLKNVVLKDALDKIAGLAKVSFVYINNNALDNDKVSITVHNRKVAKVLKELLEPHLLSYMLIDDRIVIHSGAGASAAAVPDTAAQKTVAGGLTPAIAINIDIKGQISSEKDLPLAGVSILIKGTKRGIATDAKGEFELKNVPEDAVLVISVTGYKKEEVSVSSFKSGLLHIRLKEEAAVLQDVVVTGFQNIDKKKFAGAAVSLKADDVKMDGVVDVSRMLEGRAAGVSVQNVSGTFGSAPKVRIRGATSINGDNKPLWVVDGVVLEDIVNISNDQLSSGDPTTLLGSAVAGLNANDIESFDILKDAAATALYGARAMNGVVVITTKKGHAGKTTVAYTGNYSTQLKPSYNNFDIMNSGQQMSVLGELERKGGLASNMIDNPDWGVFGKMYNEITLYDSTSGQFGLANTLDARKAFLLHYAKANTDWFGLLFRNNFMQEHSLSVSFGSDKSQSYFSTSYYGDNGWTIADKVSRYTLNFRNNYKFSDRLAGGFSTVASVRQQRAPGSLSRTSDPVQGQYTRDFDINPFSYSLNTSRTMTAYEPNGQLEYFQRNFAPFNIINELKNNYLNLSVIDTRLQGDLGYKLTKNLKWDFVGALRYVKSTREDEITENSNMANAYRADGNSTIANNNKFLYHDPANPDLPPVVVLPYGGFYNRTEDLLLSFDVRNGLSFTKTYNAKHTITVLGGQQIRYANRQDFNNTGYGYQYNNGGTPFVDYRILKETIESNFPYYSMTTSRDRFVAFYSSGAYTYDSKFNFTGTLRYDGSNQLGSSSRARWLPTWSLAGSWNVDQEKFMQPISWVDYLTLRSTYGLTASMGPATNSNVVLKNQNTNRPYADEVESVIQLVNLENSDLTWEKLYTFNLGIDAGLFNKRVNISLDAYQRKSFDLISLIKTPGIGGEAIKASNYADMNSQGLELLIGGEVVHHKDWSWKTNLTIGYNTTKITNAKNVPLIYDLIIPEGGNLQGHPVHSLFSIQYKGLDHKTGVPQFLNESGQVSPAVYLQSETTQYLKYEGPVDPPITGGFSNTFRYKALALNIFITYQAGNKIRLYPAFKASYSDMDAMPREFYDRWVMPGDEKYTNVPSIVDAFYQSQLGGGYPYNNYNYSGERVAKGDFIRLKTVSLAYNLPPEMLKRSGLSSGSITLATTNPWLLYSDAKLKGQDPEFFNSGGVAQPLQKQVTLSLKVGL
jgi:TonB-linked SusC/RagA family outer membrane protein